MRISDLLEQHRVKAEAVQAQTIASLEAVLGSRRSVALHGETLSQDCTCVNHTGPHWAHMNRFYHDKNTAIIERALESARAGNVIDAFQAMHAFAIEEASRLNELLPHVRRMEQASG